MQVGTETTLKNSMQIKKIDSVLENILHHCEPADGETHFVRGVRKHMRMFTQMFTQPIHTVNRYDILKECFPIKTDF